jgi:hypothetical protein
MERPVKTMIELLQVDLTSGKKGEAEEEPVETPQIDG